MSNRTDSALLSVVTKRPDLIRNRSVRCPCCGSLIDGLPALWTIEPCGTCKRPLALVRAIGIRRQFHLRNLIDLTGAFYGVATMTLVTAFVLSEMDARAFVKAFTILLFVIASMLSADGVLGLRTAIDRSWNVIRRGTAARVRAGGKVGCGIAGFALTMVGLAI